MMNKVKTTLNIVWCFLCEYGICLSIYFLLKTKLEDFFWAEIWIFACLAYFVYTAVEFSLDYIDQENTKNEKEDVEGKAKED